MFAVVVLSGGGYCREVLACVNESMCFCVTKIETDMLRCSLDLLHHVHVKLLVLIKIFVYKIVS